MPNQGLSKIKHNRIATQEKLPNHLIAMIDSNFRDPKIAQEIATNITVPGFFDALYQSLEGYDERSKVIKEISLIFRSHHEDFGIDNIIDAPTLRGALDSVKQSLLSYYTMIFNHIESHKLGYLGEKQQTESLVLYNQNSNLKSRDLVYFAENFFVRNDPLFWVSLFLYQKEVNSINRISLRLSELARNKELSYNFIMQMPSGKKSKGGETNIDSFVAFNFKKDEKYPELINLRETIKKLDMKNIDRTWLLNLKREFESEYMVSREISSEKNMSEKMLDEIRGHAKVQTEDREFMNHLRANLRLLIGKFSGSGQTQNDNISKFVYSPTIRNESEFFETIGRFVRGDVMYSVRNINLASGSLGLKTAQTLKGKIDIILGRIADLEAPKKPVSSVNNLTFNYNNPNFTYQGQPNGTTGNLTPLELLTILGLDPIDDE